MAGIYIHIPFCKKACIYCDFHFSTSLANQEKMVGAILHELDLRQYELKDEEIETIYFGGGTPSLLSEQELNLILKKIQDNFNVAQETEITLEANPDDLNEHNLNVFKKAGVNRLSIGVQSFFDEHLNWMNRAHNASESEESIRLAQRIGFENITIDLIYGLPMMTDDQWEENVKKAIGLKVPHISAYNLTIEHKTKLDHMVRKGESQDIDDEQGERNFIFLREELLKNDFIHYEISNFGKDGFLSKHNTSYWQGKKYLGVGPSAHSFDGQSRRWNVANNPIYIRKIEEGKMAYEVEHLSAKDQVNEHLMIGLRNMWGCSWEYLNSLGVNITPLKTEVVSKINNGLLSRTDVGFKTSETGLLFADAIAADLFLE